MKKRLVAQTLMTMLILFLVFSVRAGDEKEFSFVSSYDGSTQMAALFVPSGYDGSTSRPLLVDAHYWGGNRFTAKVQGYYDVCERLNWLVVCPELHGHRTSGQTSLAALEAQHDIIDGIEYVQRNYAVDRARIYLAGRSMGGMMAAVMAGKYPDRFAAICMGQGVTDLDRWYREVAMFREGIQKECGGTPDKMPFEYARRSAVSYVSNISYVPLIIWHGTNDTWVPPSQSEDFYQQLTERNRYQRPVDWIVGAPHCAQNYTPEWICQQFLPYLNVAEKGIPSPFRHYPELEITTDESKSYFWLDITMADQSRFARVLASVLDGTLQLNTENVSHLRIDLEAAYPPKPLTRWRAEADRELVVTLKGKGGRIVSAITVPGKGTGNLDLGMEERK
jgi:poly(3-hydroxybutyrate) depolymerase